MIVLKKKFLILILVPLIVLIVSTTELNNRPTVCLFNNILGKECHGRGITRAILSLMKGQLSQAIYYNSSFIFVFPLIVTIWMKQII